MLPKVLIRLKNWHSSQSDLDISADENQDEVEE